MNEEGHDTTCNLLRLGQFFFLNQSKQLEPKIDQQQNTDKI